MPTQRKRVKSYITPGHAHELTFSFAEDFEEIGKRLLACNSKPSDDLDLVGGDPDVDLLEASFPDLFLRLEECVGGL